ncbi:rhodanese-like domain-containing protein [Plectonema cf. radiosum LEGE 06105]|uniref:Rhodanese-like domain-containing protein n=1 Tax=Plectonema cf. radiosum LEGE 06105 TaxID=945769 RepID=A0A8J7F534_9CYAN|nr:rhodanese-like domain-containing protein [Plectonema radiosum]MBE9214488.1 rhodanese-like domain-containing protein [Plectonema cf. radiosum LEGE 06105]
MFYLLQLLLKLNFSDVRLITISEFLQYSKGQTSPTPLIIDARSPEEYAVSHLESAQLIAADNLDLDKIILSEVPLDKPIVVYCSIGYRSAKVAQHLSSAGYENVFNLSGGIFQWVNQGNPVFQNQHSVEVVHPYNSIWGKLLKSKYHA